MDKKLIEKLTAILKAIPAYKEWNIEITEIEPELSCLRVAFRNAGHIQIHVRHFYYKDL